MVASELSWWLLLEALSSVNSDMGDHLLSSGKKAFIVQKSQTDLGFKGDSAVFGFFIGNLIPSGVFFYTW